MKLILAIVSKDDSPKVMKNLLNKHFFVTKLSSTGGFLRGGNVTLMMGVQDDKVEEVMHIIEEHSKNRTEFVPNQIMSEYGSMYAMPVEVTIGGATMFIIDVEQFKKV